MNNLSNQTIQLPAKPFYVADCAVSAFSFNEQHKRYESRVQGSATLVSGAVELQFGWLATGGASASDAFSFVVGLNEAAPDFDLMGMHGLSEASVHEVCLAILASCNWQAEVAECLPKNAAELASF